MSKNKKTRDRRQETEELMRVHGSMLRNFVAAVLLTCAAFASACIRYDMQVQPRSDKYRPSEFFKDKIPGRPLVAGTVPRGYLREDEALYAGKIAANKGKAGANAAYLEGEVYEFPFPVTKEVVERGQQRYQIFCSMCHGLTGAGDGMAVQRGYKKPPSYLEDRVRTAPVGHYFDVITNGWGGMPSYAGQIPVRDRWAIIAYVRALQLSGGADINATTIKANSGATNNSNSNGNSNAAGGSLTTKPQNANVATPLSPGGGR